MSRPSDRLERIVLSLRYSRSASRCPGYRSDKRNELGSMFSEDKQLT